MNIVIPKSSLENILTNLQPFLEKKDASQITSHVYFKAEGSELTFQATDYEIGLLAKTESVQIQKEGIATVNGKKILDIVRRLKEGEITLQSQEEYLHIKQEKSSFKLPMFNAEEFPSFPSYEELPKIEINSMHLVQSMKKILPAIDNNNPKFELNGALLDIKEYSFNFVATDTRRLAVIKYENPSINKLALIVPKKAIVEIQKLFFEEVELHYSETHLILKSKNYLFFTKLISGKYPDYERIIPKETTHNMTLPKEKIIEAIKLINSLSNDIKVTFTKEEILFESLSEENSEAKTQVEVETGIAKELTLGINSKYLLDYLGQIDTSEFKIGINESNTPFILKSENFSTVIMPIVM
ncbi:DNA polymerase III subunit beta [Wolinella succinogenes]|uniref:DNA polymerase III subunit beta n=1 Tax=Wolinella succinogenes TaxID=844 RepID=UPI00240A7AC9|nr:DNA polymerase III subunit beta [Wolinella succinogenes]